MTKSLPKVAIFYDWLYTWGGAERVLLDLLTIFPNCHLYTTYYNPQKTPWLPKNIKITSLNISSFFENKLAILSPILPAFLEKYNFDKYDLVVSMGTIFNNCLLTKPKTKYLSYILSPNRYLDKYSFYKPIDSIFAQRPDMLYTISKNIQSKINHFYARPSRIIYPGTDTNFFIPNSKTKHDPNGYYLVVSRLVPHKKVDQAILACGQLQKKLIVVGTGRQGDHLESLAGKYKNISFLNGVSDLKLRDIYQGAKALLAPQNEDFGLANVEAMACGTPVIGFKKGGNIETILDKKTGILYSKQTTEDLIDAIQNFEKLSFPSAQCQQQANFFSKQKFMLDWKQAANEIL